MAVTAWRFASSGANVQTIGSVSWSAPEEIVSDNANRAYADSMAAGAISNWLRAYFGFTTSDVPAGSTINGIEAEVDTYGVSTYSVRFYAARLVIGGTIGGTNVSGMPSTNWGGTASDAPLTLGGATNLWASSPTASDVVGATFGIAIAAENYEASKSRNATVDYVKMRIYYTPADAPPADIYESIGIGVGQGVSSAPNVAIQLAMNLEAGVSQSEGSLNNAVGGVDLSAVAASALAGTADIPLEALMGAISATEMASLLSVEGLLGLDALAGMDAVKKVEFAGLLSLAVSQDFQEASQLVAVVALSLDTLIQVSGQGQGMLHAALPLPARTDTRFVGGNIYEHSAGIDSSAGIAAAAASQIPVQVEAAVRAMLGFNSPSEIQASVAIAQKSGAAAAAANSLQTSFVIGVGSRLLSSPTVGAAVSISASIASALGLVTKVSHLATVAAAVGVDLDSANLLGASGRVSVGAKSTVANIASVDYSQAISLVSRSTVKAASIKAYECLVSVGVSPAVASSLTAMVAAAVNLAAVANVTDEVGLRTLGTIALTVQQLAAVQSVLSATGTISLRHRSQINSVVAAALEEVVSLASRLRASVVSAGEIEAEALIGVSAAYSTVAKAVIGTAIALSAKGAVNQAVDTFKHTSISLGVRPQLTASSVGHFRAAIVAAITARLVILNFNPQVIRIVSELLSQSAVTDEGISVSRIVDETIVSGWEG